MFEDLLMFQLNEQISCCLLGYDVFIYHCIVPYYNLSTFDYFLCAIIMDIIFK